MEDNFNLIESADPDSNHFNDTIINFKSYTPETFSGNIDSKGSLNILHHNVRSNLTEGKKDEIDLLLNTINNPFHILAYTETWLNLIMLAQLISMIMNMFITLDLLTIFLI